MAVSAYQPLAVTASLATTGAFHYSDMTCGQVRIPSGSSITTLTWYASNEIDGTYSICADVGSAGVQTVAADKCYQIPTQLVGALCLKAVGDAAGTIHLSLKKI